MLKVSIIVPTLNEVTAVPSLSRLASDREVELIIVDGGSTDGTWQTAERAGLRVITCPPGRARQMNVGAAASTGQFLLFLHADTRLPKTWRQHVTDLLSDPSTAVGAFGFGLDAPGVGYRLLEHLVRLRRCPYGDQALFLRRETFLRLGGYPDWAILEDVELVRRARDLGQVRIAPATALTSARRWQRNGLIRTTLLNQRCLWAWRLGVAPTTIAGWRGTPSRACGSPGTPEPPSDAHPVVGA